MKKILAFIVLGSFSLVSANQYYQPYGQPYQQSGQPYYRDQQDQSRQSYDRDRQYYQQQSGQPYYRDQQDQSRQSYDRDRQYYQQQSGQPYYRDRQDQSRQAYDRDRQYDQQQSRQSYDRDQQRNVSDQEIKREIQDTIGSGWFSKGFQHVSFDVQNGNVILKGYVDTLEDKNKVEDSIRKIDGVRHVNSQIAISKGKEDQKNYSDSELQNSERKYPQDVASSPEDRQINAKIRDKLGSGWFSRGYEALVIRTNHGVVIITGSVDTVDDQQKINEQLKEIEGIRSLSNQVNVKNK